MSLKTSQKRIQISLIILFIGNSFTGNSLGSFAISDKRAPRDLERLESPAIELFTKASIQFSTEKIEFSDRLQEIRRSILYVNSSVELNYLFEQAYKAQAAENYTEAAAIWHQILQHNIDSQTKALVYNNFGDTLRIQGKLNEAIKAYQNSIEADSSHFEALVNIGITQYQIGRTKSARANLNKAKEFLPKNIKQLEDLDRYRFLSTRLRQIERFDESIQIIRQAISLNPYIANAENCQLLFEVLKSWEIPVSLMLRQYRSARCELNISLPPDPTSKEKLEAINKTILSNVVQKSQYAKTYQKVGIAEVIVIQPHPLFQPNRPDDRLNKAYSITHLNLGISLLNRAMLTGDSASLEEAIISYQQSLASDPNYSWTYLYFSIALIARGNLDEAISIARQILNLADEKAAYGSPTNTHSWAHNILGYALELQGNSNAALAEYQNALRLDKAFTSARNNIQEIQ